MMKCRKCRGKGEVPVPRVLQETLREVRTWRTAGTVWAILKAKRGYAGTFSGISVRLEKCRALGLAARRKVGRAWQYRAR